MSSRSYLERKKIYQKLLADSLVNENTASALKFQIYDPDTNGLKLEIGGIRPHASDVPV